jgi:nitrite reductase/ring-hydroxylating ferredoxin subunit
MSYGASDLAICALLLARGAGQPASALLSIARQAGPWHAARYDVGTGKMVRGPQGAFRPLAGIVKATTGAIPLKPFPVEVRDGAIWLVG